MFQGTKRIVTVLVVAGILVFVSDVVRSNTEYLMGTRVV